MQREERRRSPRASLDQLAYINLGANNGAIILNISEGGIGFHAAAPVSTEGPLDFRLSMKAIHGLEAAGELAWNDQTRKSGGLRFTKLPDALQRQIRLWLPPDKPVFSPSSSTAPSNISQIKTTPTQVSPARVIQPIAIDKTEVASSRESAQRQPAPPRQPVVRRKKDKFSQSPAVIRESASALFLFLTLIFMVFLATAYVAVFFAHRSIQRFAADEIARNAQASLRTAQVALERDHAALGRKADLLATLLAITPANDSTLQDSIDNPLITQGSDLIALTDAGHQTIMLHSNDRSVTAADAEQLFPSGQYRSSSTWWFTGGNLYQVAIRFADTGAAAQSGGVAVARRISDATIKDLGDMLGADVALSRRGEIVASTLNSFDRYELADELRTHPGSGLMQIGERTFDVVFTDLTAESDSSVRLIVLKAHTAPAEATLTRYMRLISIAVLLLFVVVFVILTASHWRIRWRPVAEVLWLSLWGALLLVFRASRNGVTKLARSFE